VDPKRAVSLAQQVGVDFGAAMTVALAYIGDRLGIFKAMADGTPLSSAEIARRVGLDERYVREWASTMASAGYLDYRPADAKFCMSTEQAMVLADENNTFFSGGPADLEIDGGLSEGWRCLLR
jgi:predicted transcriptional regulator